MGHGRIQALAVRDYVEINTGAKQGTIDAAAEDLQLIKSRHYENGRLKCWTWQLPEPISGVNMDN